MTLAAWVSVGMQSTVNVGQELTARLFECTRLAGAVRPDVEVADLSLLFEQLAAVRVEGEGRMRGSAAGTWRWCSTPSTRRRGPSCRARRPAGKRSADAGRRRRCSERAAAALTADL